MEAPIKGDVAAAFTAVTGVAETEYEKAARLTTRIAELGTPDIYGHAGIRAVINMNDSNFSTGTLRYELRADEKTKIELMDSPANNIEVTLVAERGVKGSAIDTSHPYKIEVGNLNNYREPKAGEEQKTTNQLKAILKNTTNYNIAVEPALKEALRVIESKKSVAVPPPDNFNVAVYEASKALANKAPANVGETVESRIITR